MLVACLLAALALLLRVDWQLAFGELPIGRSPAIDEALHWDWAQALAAGEGSPERPYFRAPLYPWWLGLLHAAGLGLAGLRWAGTALGLASLLLLAQLGLRHSSRLTALWLLALGGLGGAWIYYEPQLLLEHQVLFLVLAATACWLEAHRREPGWADAGLGLALALAALTRPNALLLAPLAVFLLLRREPDLGKRVQRLALWGLGWLPPLLLVAGLNGWPGSGVFIASQGGVNLWIGLNDQADGRSAVLPGRGHAWEREDAARLAAEALGRPATSGEEDAWFSAQAWRWVAENPVRATWLTVRKLGWLLGPEELGNNTSPPVLAARRPWMKPLLAISWWLVLVPGLAGLLLGLPRTPGLRPWVAGALTIYAASFLPFFITGRFRLPLFPLLALPAAELLAHLCTRDGRDWLAGRLRPVVWAGLSALALALGAAAVFQMTELDTTARRGQMAWQEFQLGNAWLRLEEPDSARAAYHRALAATSHLAEVRLNLGLLAATSRPQTADSLFREELKVDPRSAKAWNNLGALRLRAGLLAEARECYHRALELRPGLQDAAWNLGLVECRMGLEALRRGDREEAARSLAAAAATPYRGKGLTQLSAALRMPTL